MDFVCIQCGARADEPIDCTGCGQGDMLDMRKQLTRELMRETDLRIVLKREATTRYIAVGASIVLVLLIAAPFRGKLYAGLPMFADQFALMIGAAFGIIKLLEKVWPAPKRFPYLDDEPELESATFVP